MTTSPASHDAGLFVSLPEPIIGRDADGRHFEFFERGQLVAYGNARAAAEREACAQIAQNTWFGNPGEVNHEIAESIRAGGIQT